MTFNPHNEPWFWIGLIIFIWHIRKLKHWEAKWPVDDKPVLSQLEYMSFNLFHHDTYFYSETLCNY